MSQEATPSEEAVKGMKNLRGFVNESGFSDLALALIDELSGKEDGEHHEAMIAHGKILGVRFVFKRLLQLAKPVKPGGGKTLGTGKDPDLED